MNFKNCPNADIINGVKLNWSNITFGGELLNFDIKSKLKSVIQK
jgi:hypothetical protein